MSTDAETQRHEIGILYTDTLLSVWITHQYTCHVSKLLNHSFPILWMRVLSHPPVKACHFTGSCPKGRLMYWQSLQRMILRQSSQRKTSYWHASVYPSYIARDSKWSWAMTRPVKHQHGCLPMVPCYRSKARLSYEPGAALKILPKKNQGEEVSKNVCSEGAIQ